MNRNTLAAFAVVAVAAGAGAWYAWQSGRGAAEPPSLARVGDDTAGPVERIEHPIEPIPEPALPALTHSDGEARAELETFVGPERAPTLFYTDRLVRRIVASVDALPRQAALPLSPMRPLPGSLVVQGEEGAETLAPRNFERYGPVLDLLLAVDAERTVATYRRWYPLFQEAYEELGYPGRYFNDRVVEVIDHLLETPDLAVPPRLERRSVAWRYADPALEARSAGQKALLRMGPQHSARVRERLREVRGLIASDGAGRGTPPPAPRD